MLSHRPARLILRDTLRATRSLPVIIRNAADLQAYLASKPVAYSTRIPSTR